MKKQPEIYITLDQFKVLASRIKAKENWLRHIIDKYKPDSSDPCVVNDSYLNAVFAELLGALDKPADFFVLSSDVDMSRPSVVMPSQLDLFGEEFC